METLVIYFSQKGKTKEAAGRIAQLSGADLAEIKTHKSYRMSYRKTVFTALKEILLNEKKTNVFCVSVLIMGIGIIGSNWSVNEHTADFLAFANMEALARGESGSGITCWRTVSMNGAGRPPHYTYCGSCDAVLAREVADKDYCPR